MKNKNKNKTIAFTMGLAAAILLAPSALLERRVRAIESSPKALVPASVTSVATGLRNPRGLNFGPDGALYVAEAGTGGVGPCGISADNVQRCYGPTGSITRIDLASGDAQRIVRELPSLGVPPAGTAAVGPHDVDFNGLGNGYVTIGLGDDPAHRVTDWAPIGAALGRVVRFDPSGRVTFAEDLAEYEQQANPNGDDPDS